MKRIIIALITIILLSGCAANGLLDKIDLDDERLEQLIDKLIEEKIKAAM